MAQPLELMEGSAPPFLAQMLGQDLATGVAAAGTTAGTATTLKNGVNVVSTVAAGAGVILLNASAAPICAIVNAGANPLLVYPATGERFNNLSANTSFVLGVNAVAILVPSSPRWAVSVGAAV